MHTLCIETATIIKLVQQAEDIRCFIWDGPLGIHRQSPIVPFLEIHTLYRAFYPIHKGTVFSGVTWGLPWWLRRLSVCLQCRRPGFDPWVGKILWRRKRQSTPVLLPGKSHGQRSLVGYSPWGHKESDTTERLPVQVLYWKCGFLTTGPLGKPPIVSIFTCIWNFPL